VNLLHGIACPSVVCRPAGPVFAWQDAAGDWQQGDELPVEISEALPGPEWARCSNHAWRRMGDRRRGAA